MGKYQIVIELPDDLNRKCFNCPITGVTGRCRLQPNLKSWEVFHQWDIAKTCPLKKIDEEV